MTTKWYMFLGVSLDTVSLPTSPDSTMPKKEHDGRFEKQRPS